MCGCMAQLLHFFHAEAGDLEDVEEEEGVNVLSHKRGLAPFVFVPWDRVHDSPLNLPIKEMDFYVPG